MESNSCNAGLFMSGNKAADCTLLVTDIFNLFPSSFDKLIPLLEKRYRVVTHTDTGYDIFNRTKHSRHQTMDGYANDLIASLLEKNLRNITYIAHSVNAMLAFYAAVQEPQLFDKIVLLSAVPYLKQNLAAQYQSEFNSNTGNFSLLEHLIESHIPDKDNPEQLANLLGRSFAKMNADKARQIFDIIMKADSRNHLNKLNIPVMILQGAGDKIATKENSYFMHRHIPDSYIVKIMAEGHLPQLNAPEEISKAMEIFMFPAVC